LKSIVKKSEMLGSNERNRTIEIANTKTTNEYKSECECNK